MTLHRRDLLLGLSGAAAVGLMPARSAARILGAVPAPDRELKVPVRGGAIYVRVNGDLSARTAPLLMVHGGPGSSHAGFIPALPLADDRAVILYDQLDNGRSDAPNDPFNWTVERFVSEIDAIRAALNLREFHLLGQSWGGTVVNEYAARRPAGLKSLILSSPLISTKSWEASTTQRLKSLPPAVRARIAAHEATAASDPAGYEAAMKPFYDAFLLRHGTPAYLKAYKAALPVPFAERQYNAMWGPGEIRATGTLRDYDGEPLLKRITAPTLVQCGEFDEFSPAACKLVAAKVKGSTTAVIPDSGHSTAVDGTEAYLKSVGGFIGAHD
jgi:proline iminopeptidase/L-proline amide hydrolase